jgi:hypothetical protein
VITTRVKQKLSLALVLGVLALAFFWLHGHAYIEVAVEGAGKGNLQYALLDQKSQKTVEISTNKLRFRKLLSRGNYELLVTQNESSYFSVVTVGGFLGKTAVKAPLTPEKSRKFIGNNPAPCMHYTGQTLFTYSCGSSYQHIQRHVPATASQPTYTQNTSSIIEGDIEGIVKTSEGDFILIKAPPMDEDQGAPHTLYHLTSSLELQNGVPLLDLDKERTYSVQAYKQGFLVYDALFESIYYYSSTGSKPVSVNIDRPEDEQLKPYALTAQGESILLAFSNNTKGEVADIHDTTGANVKVEVVISEHDRSRHFRFKTQYSSMLLCGNNKLCLLHADELEVHDIADDKQRLLYMVQDVASIDSIGKDLLIVQEKAILNLDVESRQGAVQYSLGSYTFCGIKNDLGGYVLCLINGKSEKVALLIDPSRNNTDSIDKKVAELEKLPQVKNLSVNYTFIYVSPEMGELVFDQGLGGFVPDPAALTAANHAINQTIDRLGINRSTYTIINAFE